MFRTALQPLTKGVAAQTALRQPTKLAASGRVLTQLAAPFSTSSSMAQNKSKADRVPHIDQKIKTEYPNMSGPQHTTGPEFYTGDEGVHGLRTLKSFSMVGKVCVVTGGARGLGNLMGRALVESGCNQLAILDLDKDDSQGAADEMVKWLEGTGGVEPGSLDIRGFACDVSREESVQKAFNDVKAAFGKVHAVINSAGIVENYPALEYPTDRLLKVSTRTRLIAATSAPLSLSFFPASCSAVWHQRLWFSLRLSRGRQAHDRR